MQDALLIIIAAAFANNVVLTRFLGLCPLMGTSNTFSSAVGLSLATLLVLTLASISSYIFYHYILTPLSLQYLDIISFIFLIAGMVQLTELAMRHFHPMLNRVLGIFLPLITSNCAVLGVALLNVREQDSVFASAFFGFGSGLGFGMVLIAFAAIRERLTYANVPKIFQGEPIALITAGLMALAFMGFTGLNITQ